jgi:hypothetical protein
MEAASQDCFLTIRLHSERSGAKKVSLDKTAGTLASNDTLLIIKLMS